MAGVGATTEGRAGVRAAPASPIAPYRVRQAAVVYVCVTPLRRHLSREGDSPILSPGHELPIDFRVPPYGSGVRLVRLHSVCAPPPNAIETKPHHGCSEVVRQ